MSKLQDSSQLQKMMALYNQETLRGGGEPDFYRLRMCVKLHIDQTVRNKNFKIQNEVVERGAVSRVTRERNPSWRGEKENVYSGKRMDHVQKESLVVSATPLHRGAVANLKVKKRNASSSHRPTASGNRCGDGRSKEQSSHPAPKSKAKNDVQT